jgi:PAS domain S-box-containing protein
MEPLVKNHSIAALNVAEQNFKGFFEEARFGVVLTAADFPIIWANPAFCAMVGYPLQELLHKTFKDITHPEQIPLDMENLQKLLTGEIPVYNTEKRYIRKDGRIVWGSVTVLPVQNASGELIHFMVMVEDITARKNAEREIAEWKKRYERVTATSGQAVYYYEIQSGLIEWGGNTLEVLGYTSVEIGHIDRWEKCIHPDDRKNSVVELDRAMKEMGVYDYKYRFLHKSGRYLHIHDKGIFIGNGDGIAVSMVGMMQDITDLVNAERELIEKEERYRKLFDVSPSGIMLNDLNGYILDVNDAVCRIMGYKKQELIGKHVGMLVPVSARKEIKKHIREILKGKTFEHEVINIRKDGVLLDIILRETLIQLSDGRTGILAITNNITERKKAERSLQESREQLQRYAHHLQTIREEERSRISRELHDHLGQYLSAIKMDASGIIHKLDRCPDKTVSGPILNQANEMMTVIEEIIPAVRKIASDLHPRVLDELGLIPGIEWLVDEFIKRSRIQCKLVPQVDHMDIGPAHTIAVFRIVQEALTNVMRHSKATQVTVRITATRKAFVFSVEDNGCGIRETVLSSMKSLGILGMKERALLLGGDLSFRKNGKNGTKVVLRIPRYKKPVHDKASDR